MAWDAQSRLTNVAGPTSATSASYSYNSLDQRIGKVSNGSTFAYTHEDDAVDSAVLSDGQAVYQHGLGLISEVRNGSSAFYKTDALGSTRALTNAGGTTTDEQTTDAFGNTVSVTGTTPTAFGFAGQFGYKTDAETGLMLLGHRYYDPSTGRFLSRDPILDGYNWYNYCDNDPLSAVDPEGLQLQKNPPAKPPTATRPPTMTRGPSLIDIIFSAGGRAAGAFGLILLTPKPAGGNGDTREYWIERGETPPWAKPRMGKESKKSDKAKKNDVPGWSRYYPRREKPQSCQDWAKAMLDDKYGVGNWPIGSGSEYSQIVKECSANQ